MENEGDIQTTRWSSIARKEKNNSSTKPAVYPISFKNIDQVNATYQRQDEETEGDNAIAPKGVETFHSESKSSSTINICNKIIVKKPRLFNQIITAISIASVDSVTGFISAYTAPVTDGVKMELTVSNEQFSWIGGLVPLGALVGGVLGGQLINFIGRKQTILIADVLFLISWGCIAVSKNVEFLFISRGISGFAVGIASLAMPIYLGETIEPKVRGTLGLLPTAFGNIGILVCFLVGAYVSWRTLAWTGAVLTLPFFVMVFIIPESPRWYASRNQEQEAFSALQWLRGVQTDVQEEHSNLFNREKETTSTTCSTVKKLFERAHVKALIIALGLMFFQQFSGITAVIYYATDIFKMSGSPIDRNLSTVIIGFVNFVSTFLASMLIDRAGRKVLLYISSISMVITSITLGTYFYLLHLEYPVTEYGWIPLLSFIVYVLGFSLGFGPIPWLMLGEIFPDSIKGVAASVATAFHWICTFVVTKCFVNIVEAVGPYGTFWIFGIMCIASIVFVFLIVPETKNKSLREIEELLNVSKGVPYVFKP